MGNERVSKPIGRTLARVSVQEHMANYRAARAARGKKGARKSAVKEGTKRCDPSPPPISAFQLSEFQPFSCRPSGDGSGEKLQALLSQREVMLQLPLHSRPQILRWTCACKVPRIFPPGFDQA